MARASTNVYSLAHARRASALRRNYRRMHMSPGNSTNIWMVVSATLAGAWLGMLSFVLKTFGLRVSQLEAKDCAERFVPRPEFEAIVRNVEAKLTDTAKGISDVHDRIDDFLNTRDN